MNDLKHLPKLIAIIALYILVGTMEYQDEQNTEQALTKPKQVRYYAYQE